MNVKKYAPLRRYSALVENILKDLHSKIQSLLTNYSDTSTYHITSALYFILMYNDRGLPLKQLQIETASMEVCFNSKTKASLSNINAVVIH